MIEYVEHTNIDKILWNKCIDNAINSSFFANSHTLDILSPNWDALIYNNYEAVFPLTYKKNKIQYIYTPFFITSLGSFYTNQDLNIDFVNNIPKKFKFIDLKTNELTAIVNKKLISKLNKNYYLKLNNNYNNISKNYSNNHKRNLKKSLSNNLSISKSIDNEIIKTTISYFKKFNNNANISFKEKDYQTLMTLVNSLIDQNNIEVWSIYDQHNELTTGAFFVKKNNRIYFLFSGSNPKSRQNGSMFYLFDSIIKENATTDYILDFCGSNNPSLARFYEGFGSEYLLYPTININNMNFVLKNLFYLKKFFN